VPDAVFLQRKDAAVKSRSQTVALVVLGAVLACLGGCGNDPATPEPQGPQILPALPVPGSVNEPMPERSADTVVGMSAPLDDYVPLVLQLRAMRDDGSYSWTVENRHLTLACAGTLPVNTGDPAATSPSHISARPRLLHTRHWQRLEQGSVDPGTPVAFEKTVTWGASTERAENREFSRTLGVETAVGGAWDPFAAVVAAGFTGAATSGEIRTVCFATEDSDVRSYTVEAPAAGRRAYVLWQLVDEFRLVDADTNAFQESDALAHVTVADLEPIRFAHNDVVRLETTDFD
jgi:hypothetical protein